jgi:enoyl-CoA hydratase
MAEVDSDQLRTEVLDGVGQLVFDNQRRRNALSMGMLAAIPICMRAFEFDQDVRVVVLSGAGGQAFVSGIDLSAIESRDEVSDVAGEPDDLYEAAIRSIREFSKPTIAKISGFCIGAGVAVALAADIRICDEKSEFGIPAAKLGIAYADVESLLRAVGPAWASEILFTGRRFSSEEALQARLVSRAVPIESLDGVVGELATSIVSSAPLSVVAAKHAISEALKDPRQRDPRSLAEMVARCRTSADFAEGTKAFFEGRMPRFTGQ